MAINYIRAKVPLKISSSGSNDEGLIQHDGTDLLIETDTGTIALGNQVTQYFYFDIPNSRLGLGTKTPSYTFHISQATSASIVAQNTGGATAKIVGAGAAVQIGAESNHPVRFYVNSITQVGEFNTSGDITVPSAFATVIGGVNTDLYIDNTGLMGPNPSLTEIKTNIRPIIAADTNWIYNLTVKKCDYIDGTADILTILSEEAASVNRKVIRYTVYENDVTLMALNPAKYEFSDAMKEMLKAPEIERDDLPIYEKGIDDNGEKTLKKVWKKLQLKPFTVNKSDLIYPLLDQMQRLKTRIDQQDELILTLVSRIEALENG